MNSPQESLQDSPPISTLRFPLLAAGLQIAAWLAIMALYTLTYLSDVVWLIGIEVPLTYALLLISGVGGGGLALIGIYRLLAYARRESRSIGLLILSGLSLLWAEICIYAMLIFMAVI